MASKFINGFGCTPYFMGSRDSSYEIPESYFIKKFYECGYNVQHDRNSSVYSCSCPICHEGSSFGKKRRCFFIPAKNLIYCHNCGWSSKPATWIEEVTGMTYNEIVEESKNEEFVPNVLNTNNLFLEARKKSTEHILPEDSVNLFDESQIAFYKTNSVVRKCLEYLKTRRLDSAVNRPHAFYVSLAEGGHKARVLIPFCDENGKIIYYQSRAIGASHNDELERVKYLSKKHVSKTIFGIERVDPDMERIYILEGPIDACFVKNGIAVAGITEGEGDMFCESQDAQRRNLMLNHDFVWILDNPWKDSTARKRTEWLLRKGERVFFWPKELSDYKDVNDYCVSKGLDEFPQDIIDKNIIEGENARASFLLQMSLSSV